MTRIAITCALLFVCVGCAQRGGAEPPSSDPRSQAAALQPDDVTTSQEHAAKHSDFRGYWFAGLAELNRFELEQARYGELHKGEAVMVFVTEPFLPGEQVKQDFGDDPSAIQILKQNFYRRFYTGVYPYTVLTSTFTPTKSGPTLKLSQSMQEWCGQFFAQLNRKPDSDGYDGVAYSYFQAEGDQKFTLENTLLEDELYTRIRLGPDKLPTGELQILPGSTYLRLAHKPWKVATATASLGPARETEYSDEPVRTYTVEYNARTLKIHFETAFPHRIVAFEDSYTAIFNPEGGKPERLTTRGRLTNSIMLDYWQRHRNRDAVWKDALGLTM